VTLRADLLAGRRIALAGVAPRETRDHCGGSLAEALRSHGADVEPLGEVVEADEQAIAAWCEAREPLHGLLVDARAAFADGGPERLGAALELGWRATRAVAVHGLIPAARGGSIVLIGPDSGAGMHAEAATAGLENLARTLSVEWARFSITTVCLAPGPSTTSQDLEQLVVYLLSPAGAYVSGARLSLGVAVVAS
jgi:NAD(P)-dependent dehydrogenase (short-subunit alcohol dehydrogenase family)